MLLPKRQHNDTVFAEMQRCRTSYEPQYRDIGDYIRPNRLHLSLSDTNRGQRRNHKIIDGTATLASNILRAGMTSGISSPSSPWFEFGAPDPDMNEYRPVKRWLESAKNVILTMLAGTTLYSEFPTIYQDTADFGTNATLMEEDFDDVARFTTFPVGSYWLGLNSKNQINSFAREFQYSVRQMVEEYAWDRETNQIDWSKLSPAIKNAWDHSNYQTMFTVRHLILPNPEYNPKKLAAKFKRYQSTHYEVGAPPDLILRESGYDQFRVMAPRWNAASGDIYGTSCPGMDCLGDVKQLQFGELRGAEAVDKMLRPPTMGDSKMRGQVTSMFPGAHNWVDGEASAFKPVYQVDFRLEPLEVKQAAIRQRINKYYYADLFTLTALSDRRDVTAREIAERHEEKLIQLGPTLELMNNDLLRPIVDNAFEFCLRRGMFPPPPPELQGQPLKVEFISIMHQAQKSANLGGLERLSNYIFGLVAQTQDPSHYDKVNFDSMVGHYADSLGTPAKIIRTDDEVLEIRNQRAQAQQAAQSMEAIKTGAGAARDLASAKLSDPSALTALVGQAEGVN